LKDSDAYNELITFFEKGQSFLLSLGDIAAPFNLEGGVKSNKSYADNSYIAEFQLTSALDQDEDFTGFDTSGLGAIAATVANKKSALDKLKSWGQSTIDFVSDTNGAVGGFTGAFQDYALAINQISGGIAASSSIITTPINSITNSVSSVVGGISAAINSIGTAIEAIRQLPSQVGDMLDSILALGDQLSGIFNSNNKQDQLKTTCDFLIDIGNGFIETSQQPVPVKTVEENPYRVIYDPTYYVINQDNKNIEVLSVLMLSTILLALYEQASQVTRWNSRDLQRLFDATESLFEKIIVKDIDVETRVNLIAVRNIFLTTYKALFEQAAKIQIVNVEEPAFLFDVVYSINGNFDYYLNTKKLNNRIGSVAQGKIEVISNG